MMLDEPDMAVRDRFSKPATRAGCCAGRSGQRCTACRCMRIARGWISTEAEALEARIVNLPSSAVLGMNAEGP